MVPHYPNGTIQSAEKKMHCMSVSVSTQGDTQFSNEEDSHVEIIETTLEQSGRFFFLSQLVVLEDTTGERDM
jgi:hypothetical protein